MGKKLTNREQEQELLAAFSDPSLPEAWMTLTHKYNAIMSDRIKQIEDRLINNQDS